MLTSNLEKTNSTMWLIFRFDDLGNIQHLGVTDDPKAHDHLLEKYEDALETEVPIFAMT